jgi:8-oxo-dGTP diphosphatase
VKPREARVAQAGAIAIARGEKPLLLLVRPLKSRNEWIFPKGHIERGETVTDAALRELREEAGVSGRLLARVGSSSFVSNHENVSVTYYLIETVHRRASQEVREQRWCTIDDALELLTHPDAKRLVRKVSRLVDAGLSSS